MCNLYKGFNCFMEFTEEELKNEVCKDVVGYEGPYRVSNLGRVKGLERFVKDCKGRVRLFKGFIHKQNFLNYIIVMLPIYLILLIIRRGEF